MRFADFLRATVLSSLAAGTALIIATLAGVNDHHDLGVLWISLVWWLAAAAIGLWSGRAETPSDSIGTLLAAARSQAGLPELAPSRTYLNRLWPLMLCTVVAGGVAVVVPQAPAVAAGFMIIGACAWRRQASAVSAIEGRDGARFYVDRTAFWQPIRLIRTPGFRANLVEVGAAVSDPAGRPPPGGPGR